MAHLTPCQIGQTCICIYWGITIGLQKIQIKVMGTIESGLLMHFIAMDSQIGHIVIDLLIVDQNIAKETF